MKHRKIVIPILLGILIFIIGIIVGNVTKKTPTLDPLEVTKRDLRIDSLLQTASDILNDRDALIKNRDTIFLAKTHEIHEKHTIHEKEINRTPDAMQHHITRRLHAEYDKRRAKESK